MPQLGHTTTAENETKILLSTLDPRIKRVLHLTQVTSSSDETELASASIRFSRECIGAPLLPGDTERSWSGKILAIEQRQDDPNQPTDPRARKHGAQDDDHEGPLAGGPTLWSRNGGQLRRLFLAWKGYVRMVEAGCHVDPRSILSKPGNAGSIGSLHYTAMTTVVRRGAGETGLGSNQRRLWPSVCGTQKRRPQVICK